MNIYLRNAVFGFWQSAQSRSVGLAFVTNSLIFGTWAALVPVIQSRISLTNGELGLVLLALPVGALASMTFSGRLIQRWQVGPVLTVVTLLYCLTANGLFWAQSAGQLVIALLLFGAANGLMDVLMNTAADVVEQQQRISFWSACHGLWSVGGMLGASFVSFCTPFLTPVQYVGILTGLLLIYHVLVSAPVWRHLRSAAEQASTTAVRFRASLLNYIIIGLCVMLAEGTMADWSAVYLEQVARASLGVAGLGYAGFSLAMALGRFGGDALRNRYGDTNVVMYGTALSVIGLAVALLIRQPIPVIVGFFLSGLGFANVVPVVFKASSRVPGLGPGVGIATVSFFAYGGFLAGPPIIGFIAQQTSLVWGISTALWVTLLALIVAKFSRL